MSNPDELLSEIVEIISKQLDTDQEAIQKILTKIDVDEENYKKLMILEVVGDVTIEAQFAFPPHKSRTPEEVKAKALNTLSRKLERDKRLFLP